MQMSCEEWLGLHQEQGTTGRKLSVSLKVELSFRKVSTKTTLMHVGLGFSTARMRKTYFNPKYNSPDLTFLACVGRVLFDVQYEAHP